MSGAIVWFTGRPGAGKSTLALALQARLVEAGRSVEVLDGDVLRTELSPGLGFSRGDREAHLSRVAFISTLLARHGVTVVVATISPYATARSAARTRARDAGVPFVEVYVNASIETAASRDPKGLYRRARAGDVANFTGVSDPYEPPAAADITVDTDTQAIDASLEQLWNGLTRQGFL